MKTIEAGLEVAETKHGARVAPIIHQNSPAWLDQRWLNDRAERAWWDALFCQRLFRRQAICLAVSNRQAALSRADHVLVLREGRLAGEGRLAALLETCVEMRRVFVGQT
jgi:hypothetical protein